MTPGLQRLKWRLPAQKKDQKHPYSVETTLALNERI